jgi:hypothetical protein
MYKLNSIIDNYLKDRVSRLKTLLDQGKITPIPVDIDCTPIFHSHHALTANPLITLPSYKFKCDNCLKIESLTDNFSRITPQHCIFQSGEYSFDYKINSLPCFIDIKQGSTSIKQGYKLDDQYLTVVISDLIAPHSTHLATFVCNNNSFSLSYTTNKTRISKKDLPTIEWLLDKWADQYQLTFHGLHWQDISFSPCPSPSFVEGEAIPRETGTKEGELKFNQFSMATCVIGNTRIEPLFIRTPLYPLVVLCQSPLWGHGQTVAERHSESLKNMVTGGWIPDYLMLLLTMYISNMVEINDLSKYWTPEGIKEIESLKLNCPIHNRQAMLNYLQDRVSPLPRLLL